MLNKLEMIIKDLEKTESELQEVEKQVIKMDMDRIKKAIEISKKGFDWEKIYSDRTVRNSDGYYCGSDEYEYFNEKGILLDEIVLEDVTYHDGDSKTRKRELWLLNNGQFKVYYFSEDYSNWQGQRWGGKRIISKYQEIEQFDFDSILENIFDNLEYKLKKLGDRTKTQKQRLEKLQAIKISA